LEANHYVTQNERDYDPVWRYSPRIAGFPAKTARDIKNKFTTNEWSAKELYMSEMSQTILEDMHILFNKDLPVPACANHTQAPWQWP
jgi:hypothetical protein